MRKIPVICCLLIAAILGARPCLAQDDAKIVTTTRSAESQKPAEPPAHYYRMDFVVQEVGTDGKPTNSRSYSSALSTRPRDQGIVIRTGSRIPIITGSVSGADGKLQTQFQYLDVGVNISTLDAREVGGDLALYLSAEITSLGTPTGLSNPSDPVIRQNKWQSPIVIPIGKPTVVFTSDALENKGGMQLSVTATLLK